MDFQVGSKGDKLSGGQRQKLAIARVFLKDPKIMILDEATSALDNKSQARIQNLLETRWKGGSTVIAVVHRLDIIKNYDRVVVMKAGKIGELGTYDELMAKKGCYMNSSMEKDETCLTCEFDKNLSILREIYFFSELPLDTLKVLAYLCSRENFKSGDYLFHQKDDDAGHFISSAVRPDWSLRMEAPTSPSGILTKTRLSEASRCWAIPGGCFHSRL